MINELMNNSKKIAIFKRSTDDFEKYYNQKLEEKGCTVYLLEDFGILGGDGNKKKIAIKKIRSLCLLQFDLIIVFDEFKIIPILRLKMHSNARLILWNWNIQIAKNVIKEKIISPFCEVWTFDSSDAKNYGWKLNNQFYIPDSICQEKREKKTKRAICVCVDKKRYQTMKSIRNCLIDNGVDCDFFLVKDGTSTYLDEDSDWLKECNMSYNLLLRHTIESDIIVELVQPGQSGLTIRTLEALFYNKKLITNNANVGKYPFYCKKNILLWPDEIREMNAFLQGNYQIIDGKIKELFGFEKWISGFYKK